MKRWTEVVMLKSTKDMRNSTRRQVRCTKFYRHGSTCKGINM